MLCVTREQCVLYQQQWPRYGRLVGVGSMQWLVSRSRLVGAARQGANWTAGLASRPGNWDGEPARVAGQPDWGTGRPDIFEAAFAVLGLITHKYRGSIVASFDK